MVDFKKWISYLYAYSGEVKGNNVGFARVEVRDGQCRLTIGIKGAYGCDTKGLNVGIYIRRQGRPQRIAVGTMRIREGSGEFGEVTEAEDLFGKGISLEDCGGLWLTSSERETIYLASWEKVCLDVREFLPVEAEDPSEVHVEITAAENASCCKNCSRDCGQAFSSLEQLPQPSLWESLSRYYPRIQPTWQDQGLELLQIRPADIRYLPRSLWYYGSNSFLLHGYYHYKHLVLGRISTEEGQSYFLGVPGMKNERERYSAKMFGFYHFLPRKGQEGYWYTQIYL